MYLKNNNEVLMVGKTICYLLIDLMLATYVVRRHSFPRSSVLPRFENDVHLVPTYAL